LGGIKSQQSLLLNIIKYTALTIVETFIIKNDKGHGSIAHIVLELHPYAQRAL
jgi:hypothetical protein